MGYFIYLDRYIDSYLVYSREQGCVTKNTDHLIQPDYTVFIDESPFEVVNR